MRKRLKDFAYSIKEDLSDIQNTAAYLDQDESRFYKQWEEPKTDEKGLQRFENGIPLTRSINAPVHELKQLQRKILRNIFPTIILPKYYFGGIKGKDAVLNARYHQGNKYFLLTDLKDFFPSIAKDLVERALRKEGFYPDVARLITRICTKQGAIPQGCPTSSFLASLVVHHAIGDILDKHEKEGKKVSLYVDDITISSPRDFKGNVNSILEELRERGLKINFQKTYYKTKNPRVTGVVVKNNGICPFPISFEKAVDFTQEKASRDGHKHRIEYIDRIKNKQNGK